MHVYANMVLRSLSTRCRLNTVYFSSLPKTHWNKDLKKSRKTDKLKTLEQETENHKVKRKQNLKNKGKRNLIGGGEVSNGAVTPNIRRRQLWERQTAEGKSLEWEVNTLRNVSQVCETGTPESASFNPNTSPDKRNSQIQWVTPWGVSAPTAEAGTIKQ